MDKQHVMTGTRAKPSGLPMSASAGKRGRWRSAGVWTARCVLALCLLGGIFTALFPAGRSALKALAILPGILSASQPTWQQPIAEAVIHTRRTISTASGPVYLDVYAPSTGAPLVPGSREGMLMITGVGDNRQEPQVINFAQTLARAGIVVMGVTTPALIDDRVDAGDREAVVEAFHVLQHWPGVGAARVGMFGISAGSALICLAAADARIRDQVAFISLLGAYFDTTTLLETLGRRAQIIDGRVQPWSPVAVPLQALSSTIAPALPASDGALLIQAFASYPAGALNAQQLAQLAPQSAAAYHLLAGDQPDKVAENLAAFTPDLRRLLVQLSPSSVVAQLHAPVYLLHDRSDQFVPVSESQAFADALERLHHSYDFAKFGIFQHADVRAGTSLPQLFGDGQRLFQLLSKVAQVGS